MKNQCQKECTKKIVFFSLVILISCILVPRIRAQQVNYDYRAFVTEVYDGDTITLDADLGFNVNLKGLKIRLYGINSPEKRTKNLLEKKAGEKVREIVANKLINKFVVIRTIKDKKGKYGRYLAMIYLDGKLFNDWLISEKLVKPYFGAKKDPWTNKELNEIIDYYEN